MVVYDVVDSPEAADFSEELMRMTSLSIGRNVLVKGWTELCTAVDKPIPWQCTAR